jgi:signal peptidase I
VTIDGRTGTVLPPGNSIASETVRVTRVVPPESDAVKKVRYYVDNKPVYSTDTLRPFDYRYVTSRYQKVDTVIEYASGQRISLAEHIPDTHSDTFFNFLFRGFQTNPQVFTLLGGIAGLLAVGAIILAIVHSIERRHYWRLAHGFIQEKVQKNQQLRSFKDTYRLQKIKKGIGYFLKYGALVTSLLVLAIGINRYVGTLYSVDGISMTNTFHDKAEVLVNRIPVTLAALAGRSYVPQRGEVVIMNAAYGFVHSQTHTEGFIIKRVLGLPGERVVVKDGVITVYTADGIAIQPDSDASWQSTMIATTSAENIDLTLDENELFISGDNRQDSVDSRYNGPITTDQLVGTVVLKLW